MGVIIEQIRNALRSIEDDIDTIRRIDAEYLYDSTLDDLSASALKLLVLVAEKRAERAFLEKVESEGDPKHPCYRCRGTDKYCSICGICNPDHH